MSETEPEEQQRQEDQPCSRTIRFKVLKLSGLTSLPLFKNILDLTKDSKGDVIYETEDGEAFEVKRGRGEVIELQGVGGVDGDMKFSVKTGAVEGDETTFIIKIWNKGREFIIPIPEKDILSISKVRSRVFGCSGWMLPKQTNDDWQEECERLYENAEQRGDVTITEFHEMPVLLDFLNYIEGCNPVFDKKELSVENNKTVWYDEASHEIRPMRKHFDELINSIPGMTAKRYATLTKSLRKKNGNGELVEGGQVRLGKDNKKYVYWVIEPDVCPEVMGRVRAQREKRTEGLK